MPIDPNMIPTADSPHIKRAAAMQIAAQLVQTSACIEAASVKEQEQSIRDWMKGVRQAARIILDEYDERKDD